MNFESLRHVFKEYDIRGKSGTELNYDFARRLGWAYAEFVNARKSSDWVSIGYDARISSSELKEGLIKGLTEAGLNVFDIGLVPTPVLYFSLFELPVTGGIMITASHNPPDENGFKIAAGKTTISSDEVQKLFEIFCSAENPQNTGEVREVDVISDYKNRLLDEFSGLRELPLLNLALDAGCGAAGPIALDLIKQVGCNVIALGCIPDGTFPIHQPDPTVRDYMKILSDIVVNNGLDFGIGLDGDGDRLGVVDEKGELLWGDRLMLVFARDVLEKKPGAKIVSEVKCSNFLFKDIAERGGVPVVWKAGHSLIKKKMDEERADLGGEMSGHYMFKDRYYGYDDAIYAALRIIEIAKRAKEKNIKFSELFKDMAGLYATGEVRIPVPPGMKFRLVEELKEGLKKLDIPGFKMEEILDIDGIRISYDHGFALLRPSNTQEVVVVRIEADSKEGLELLQRYFLGTVENKIRQLS